VIAEIINSACRLAMALGKFGQMELAADDGNSLLDVKIS